MFTVLSCEVGSIADGVELRLEVAERLHERGAVGLAADERGLDHHEVARLEVVGDERQVGQLEQPAERACTPRAPCRSSRARR